ncbi:MAG: transposase [Methylocella sp.]
MGAARSPGLPSGDAFQDQHAAAQGPGHAVGPGIGRSERSHRVPARPSVRQSQEADAGRGARNRRRDRNRQDAAHSHQRPPAQEIADLYKRRWQIELFFRVMKQTLKITKFLGRSETRCEFRSRSP